MALITLTGRRDPIEIPNQKANQIKSLWMDKSSQQTIVDLGRITFYVSQIKSIELQNERTESNEDYNRPLTQEEQKNRAAAMKRIRKNLEEKGIIKHL